jgi:hypothetical protein
MREIRTSGSEGGVGSIPHPYLYIWRWTALFTALRWDLGGGTVEDSPRASDRVGRKRSEARGPVGSRVPLDAEGGIWNTGRQEPERGDFRGLVRGMGYGGAIH